MKKLLFILGLVFVQASAWSQNSDPRNCATMEVLQQLQAQDPGLAARMQQIESQTTAYVLSKKNQPNTVQAVITIPVVFHIVYNTTAQNISDAKVLAQIDQLNKDFARLNTDASNTPSAFAGLAANTGIQFCLAVRDPNGNATTGIERRQTTVTSFGTNDNIKYYSKGGLDAWPAGSYLNLWSGNLGSSLLGYAQFPGGTAATDGVVVLYSSVGSMLNPGTALHYDLGRTATHEVGHWVNLRHIWGDDGGSCSGSDLVGDTPNQGSENYGCPGYPLTDACSPSAPGVMFMNYMDYTYDNCMNMFSSGQSSRMNALFASGGARYSLLSSQGCVPVTGGTTCGVPSGQGASGITTSSATLSWGTVTNAVSYTVQYRATGTTGWTTVSTGSTSVNISGLNAATPYEWQNQTVCSSAASSFSSLYSFTTLSSGGCADNYESNNTSSTAKSIPANTDLTALISSSTDVDWFTFTTAKPNTKVKITLTNLPADYDVVLYNTSLTQLGISQNSGTANETIIYNQKNPRTYLVKVIGYGGAYDASNCYTLRAGTGSGNWREMDGTVSQPPESPSFLSNASVFPNPSDGNFSISYSSTGSSQVTLRITDLLGRTLFTKSVVSGEGDNKISVDLNDQSRGIYFAEVRNNESVLIKRFIISK